MESVLSSLSQHAAEILLFLLAALLILALAVWRQTSRLRKLEARWVQLLAGSSGENLERLLYDHLRERVQLETKVLDSVQKLAVLEEKVAGSKRHLGLVRYDAFDDVGGAQSFALAVCDDRGNGFLLNGIVGRTDCRVYCKALQNGGAERNLSPEESRALELAGLGSQSAVVSP